MLLAMHLPDHTLSPTVAVAASVAAVVGAAAIYLLRSSTGLAPRSAGASAAVTALIFAGQMVNYAIPGAGVSGHLLGAALAVMLVGPLAAAGSIAIVLAVQCLLFGDGGATALGANVVNMAIVGIAAAYGTRRVIANDFVCAAAAGFASVIAAASACGIELLMSGASTVAVGRLLAYHVAIGVVEAALTAAVVAAYAPSARRLAPRTIGIASLAAAALIVVAVAPLASELPDALEATLELAGFTEGGTFWAGIGDYESLGLSLLGVVAAFAIALASGGIGLRRSSLASPR